MKGDFSRDTFVKEKHYSGVLMQQGRVQVDADWNEQLAIDLHRDETEARDVIGQCGAPEDNAGFEITITGGKELQIGKGRLYVDGILCENDDDLSYSKQPDLPNAPDVLKALKDDKAMVGLVYLEVWPRHITSLDDDRIREKALGGPDTATRAKTVCQVKVLPLPSLKTPQQQKAAACDSVFPEWNEKTAPSTGMLDAAAKAPGIEDNPCLLPPSAGYQRLENQLYRVEIHEGGDRKKATFKWSRDNGSVVTAVESFNTAEKKVTVRDVGRDEVLGFAKGQWAEIVDDNTELNGLPGQLLLIDAVDPATREIKFKTAPAAVDAKLNPQLRRWDQAGPSAKKDGVKMTAGPLPLEGGIEVTFSDGTYRTGDYWLIPARTNIGTIEWPPDGVSAPSTARLPLGIRRHYCRLALIARVSPQADQLTRLFDCRNLFPPLTRLTSFFYLGGDGQEALPDKTLPHLLRVGVANDKKPVAGARVRFTVAQGGGTVQGVPGPAEILTGADGVATCVWVLGNPAQVQEVTAELLDKTGVPRHLPIRFGASFLRASQVLYDPAACPDLQAKNVGTVQQAIDVLCQTKGGGGCAVVVGKGGRFERLDAAFTALLKENATDICICLLPGEHLLPDGLALARREDGAGARLKIEGCGPGSLLVLPGPPAKFSLLESVTFRDVGVRLAGPESRLIFDRCDAVALESCRVFGVRETGELISIGGARRIHLANGEIEAPLPNALAMPQLVFQPFAEIASLFKTFEPAVFARQASPVAAALAALNPPTRAQRAQIITARAAEAKPPLGELDAYNAFVAELNARKPEADLLADRLHAVRNAAVRARSSLAIVVLDAGADTRLVNNEIFGAVSLYGVPGAVDLTDAELKRFKEVLAPGRIKISESKGSLHLSRNRLSRVTIGESMVKTIKELSAAGQGALAGVYGKSFFTNNLLGGGDGLFLSVHLTFTSNSFEPVSGRVIPPTTAALPTPGGVLAGTVIGDSVIYVGNHGRAPQAGQPAGTLPPVPVLFNVARISDKTANLGLDIRDL